MISGLRAKQAGAAIDASLLLDLWTTARYVNLLIQEEMAAAGSTGADLALLSEIALHGPLTVTELTELMGDPYMTTSDGVGRLANRREVTKVAHPTDGRSALVTTSKEGMRRAKVGGKAVGRVGAMIEGHLRRSPSAVAAAVRDLRRAVQTAYEEGGQ